MTRFIEIREPASSQAQAKINNRTFFVDKEEPCACGKSPRWAHNAQCMGCYSFDGQAIGDDEAIKMLELEEC